jgi:hypothetical protein
MGTLNADGTFTESNGLQQTIDLTKLPGYSQLQLNFNSSNFHVYEGFTPFALSSEMSSSDTYTLLLEHTAPGVNRSTPVQNGDIEAVSVLGVPAGIPSGRIMESVDSNNLSVTNITMPGHLLAPGLVYRQVVEVDGVVGIGDNRSYGDSALNSLLPKFEPAASARVCVA